MWGTATWIPDQLGGTIGLSEQLQSEDKHHQQLDIGGDDPTEG